MMREQDRCVTISVEPVGIAVAWVIGVGLAVAGTYGDLPHYYATVFAIVVVCWAATWTVSYRVMIYHRLIRQAFELGRETERANVRAIHPAGR